MAVGFAPWMRPKLRRKRLADERGSTVKLVPPSRSSGMMAIVATRMMEGPPHTTVSKSSLLVGALRLLYVHPSSPFLYF
jgi:hypothetical protein